ncbi:hypothetical protein JXA40_07105 [bacterium]|nr:hypothetical protein [candidate division CSSED10-310 bacterium]
MSGKRIWQTFFDEHAPFYNDNVFTRNTIREADFLEEELKLHRGASILDVGCGTGRHSVELARRATGGGVRWIRMRSNSCLWLADQPGRMMTDFLNM